MIDGYKIKDGRVIVINYDKNNGIEETEREYQDNIEELLIAENIEDYLNDLKMKAEEDIKAYENKIKKCKDKNSENNSIFISGIVSSCFVYFLFDRFINLLVILSLMIGLKLMQSIPIKRKIKEYRKAIVGTEFVLEGISNQIDRNQRDLRRLRNDNRCECENIRNCYKQFDLTEFNVIEDNLELWYRVGEEEVKYLNLLEKGTIEENLKDRFEYEDVKALKRVLMNRRKK